MSEMGKFRSVEFQSRRSEIDSREDMARRLVQLSSERMDLEEFPIWCPNGEVFAIEENKDYLFVGPALEVLSDPEEMLAKAIDALNRYSALIIVLSSFCFSRI
jgi:hypothetical protein